MIINLHKSCGERTIEFYHDAFEIEKENVFTGSDQKSIRRFKRKINRYRRLTARYFKQVVGELEYRDLTPEDIKRLHSLGYTH